VPDLFVEEARLDCGGRSSGRFAAGDTDDTEDGQFGEGRARDKDAVCRGIEVGRGDLDAVVQHCEKVIRNYAFDGFPVAVTQADPKSVELGSAEKGLALGFEVIGKLANEIDRAHLGERNLLVLAVRSQKVNGISLTEPRRVQIAADGLLVGKDNDDFLVSRGWGSVFQRNQL
jgi:hypothetical protein